MSFMRPLFILVVWVFILAQFKNYLNLKELQVRSSLEPQNLEMLISNNSDSTTWQSEEQLLMKESWKTESQIIVDTEPTQLSESIWNTNITSDQNSANNETQNSEQTIIEKTPSEDSDLESTERIPENQIILDQNEITDEWDTGTSLESVSSEKLLSTSDPSPPDNSDSSEELSWNISSATDQDTWELPSVSKMSSDEKYYTCEKWKIVIDDSIAQRRMIKSYCDNVLGEIVNGWWNIKYYLCTLPNKKEVWIEYIAEQLCK
jgi:hypothetical protein